jgi:hypothetical protein
MTTGAAAWHEAVSRFGAASAAKLAGPGEPEAAIRAPLSVLIETLGELCGRAAVMHDEVHDDERRVRPDYGVSVNQVVMGYVEVKAPGHTIDPGRMSGHDLKQWERQKDLPNLLYTNGTQWRLYEDGEVIDEATLTTDALEAAGESLRSNEKFASIIRTFLDWKAAAITSVGALVQAVAPLTRLLRGEVLDQIQAERRKVAAGAREYDQPFIGLARDWRRLLFPQADDKTFADGYAQTVTFALLLARTTGIEVEGRGLHDVGQELGHQHSLMGRALQLLTDYVAVDFKVSLDLLVTVIGAVRWDRIRGSRRDIYLYLYEEFLAEYDDELRQASGTYYTPREVVNEMVRLTQEVLVDELSLAGGFASPAVFTVDPAMGTGTFLHSIIETVRAAVAEESGPGAVPGALSELARRIAGFEIQMGPYAVAELRVAELLAAAQAALPSDGLKLYVTDTLDDPTADETQIASGLQMIAQSRRRANALKRNKRVNVVIGNPPYRELASGLGGWVENGSAAHRGNSRAILADFLVDVPGRIAAKVKNLYVYFWRWSTWKVWESTPDDQAGVVCLITTSGYLTGNAFTAMRRYLRANASDGWIIDLTPEGQTPDVPTRIFPGVRQPLAIGIFVRRPGTDRHTAANVRFISLHGRRADKFTRLARLHLDSPDWRPVRDGWTAPFTAAADSDWDTWPSMDMLMPWFSPGVFPTRTWVYSPSANALRERWSRLVAESDAAKRAELMKDSTGAKDKKFKDLPGFSHPSRLAPISALEPGAQMEPLVDVGFRAFDRQKLIADPRLIHRAREALWAARLPGQVYVVELHTTKLRTGPALTFFADMPDFHAFKGSEGGRTLPALHPDGEVNVAPGLAAALSEVVGSPIQAEEVLPYIAAVTAHPGYRETFVSELDTPGVRVPMTRDSGLWAEAVEIGRELVWAETLAGTFTDDDERPPGAINFGMADPRRVTCTAAVNELPTGVEYDAERQEIVLGNGRFGPVPREVFDYEVGGKQVLKSWIAYRSAEPAGRRSSPLDDVNPITWEHSWTKDLIEVLSAIRRVVELEARQASLLERILTGPIASSIELARAGASWPVADADRKPKYAMGLY